MPRNNRIDVGGEIYHVINRANGRMKIFEQPEDFRLFEKLLLENKELVGMRILAYIIMSNHWHLVLYPKRDGDLGTFMHRLSNAHTRKVHAKTKTNGSGHLYQGRYKSFLVENDNYLLTLIKYVERNPVRAGIVKKCEDWQWGSAWRRLNGAEKQKQIIDESPVSLPVKYSEWINTPDNEDQLESIRTSMQKGVPFGGIGWVDQMVCKFNLESTLREPGRPRNSYDRL